MSHHTHILVLQCVGAQSQSLYRTVYSNQAVTFSSTPAGTSASLMYVHYQTHPHTFPDPVPETFLRGKHIY